MPATRESIIDQLHDMNNRLGRVPSRDEFSEEFSIHNTIKIFGSYTNLLIEAGLDGQNKKTIKEVPKVISPLLPDDDIPVEDIIETMCKRFGKRKNAHDAKKWMEFKIDTDMPIGICWFGDPHIDDDGCNWPLLKEHIEICKNTEGLFGANIGDTHNNWVGRLMKEYANQNTSRGTAFRLIDWFFKESGVAWLIMLLGNHDSWNFGSESMSKIAEHVCPMIDWRAQIKLKFNNGRECLIDAAHDHSGHSQWNSLHGQQKASSMGGIAHMYIAGHKHNWALAQNECSQTGRIYWLARARGYKHIDHYAENLGFGNQKHGSSIISVIDPQADDINMVRCFADLKEGAEYLTYLRSKLKAS